MGRMHIVRGEKVLAALIPLLFLSTISSGKKSVKNFLYNRLRWDQKMQRHVTVFLYSAFLFRNK